MNINNPKRILTVVVDDTNTLTEDLTWLFVKAMDCNRLHRSASLSTIRMGFCDACQVDIERTLITRDSLRTHFTVTLNEIETCALLRQLFHQHLTHEGTSGPIVHRLLSRIRQQIGPARYAEFVEEPYPERLKP